MRCLELHTRFPCRFQPYVDQAACDKERSGGKATYDIRWPFLLARGLSVTPTTQNKAKGRISRTYSLPLQEGAMCTLAPLCIHTHPLFCWCRYYHFVFDGYATFSGAYILLSSKILGVRTTEIARTSKASV